MPAIATQLGVLQDGLRRMVEAPGLGPPEGAMCLMVAGAVLLYADKEPLGVRTIFGTLMNQPWFRIAGQRYVLQRTPDGLHLRQDSSMGAVVHQFTPQTSAGEILEVFRVLAGRATMRGNSAAAGA